MTLEEALSQAQGCTQWSQDRVGPKRSVRWPCKPRDVQLATLSPLQARKLQPSVQTNSLLPGDGGQEMRGALASCHQPLLQGHQSALPLPSSHPTRNCRQRPAAAADFQGWEQKTP